MDSKQKYKALQIVKNALRTIRKLEVDGSDYTYDQQSHSLASRQPFSTFINHIFLHRHRR